MSSVEAWPLCRAVLTCQARRLTRAARMAPAPIGLALAGVLVAPLALVRAGTAAGTVLGPALADVGAATAFVAATSLSVGAVGALLVVVSPGSEAFGALVAASPVGRRAVVAAGTVVPLLVVSFPLLLAAGLFFVPAIGKAPGGALAVGALLPVVAGAFIVGALCAECSLQVRRGRVVALVGILVLSGAWLACGLVADVTAFGPCALAGGALAGDIGVVQAAAWSTFMDGVVLAAWLLLVAGRPGSPPARRSFVVLRVSRGDRTGLACGLLAVLGRRGDLRRALLVAVGFGLGGAVVAYLAGLPQPLPLQLGVATVALGAGAAPLAAGGALLEGHEVWWPAPRRRTVPWLAVAAGNLALLVAAAPILAFGVMVGAVDGPVVFAVAVVASLTAATAVTAGAVVPLTRGRAGDQVVAFAVFGVAVVAVGVGTGQAGGRLVAAGVPEIAVAAGLVVLGARVASWSLAARMRAG